MPGVKELMMAAVHNSVNRTYGTLDESNFGPPCRQSSIFTESVNSDKEITADSDSVTEWLSIVPTTRHQGKHLVSSDRTLMNILKGMVGPGCFSLASAFANCGLWTGFVLTFVIGALNLHCMNLLVASAQYLCGRTGRPELDYGHMAKKAFEYGPNQLKAYSNRALYITNAVLCLYQMGVCSVCIVFSGANMQHVILSIAQYNISTHVLMSIMLILLLILCMITHLKFLAILSSVANVLMLVAFIIVFQYILQPPTHYGVVDTWFHSFDRLLLFVGKVSYAYGGQAIILPMENKMKHPQDMLATCGVLDASMLITTAMYAATGFFGFIKLGSHVNGSITLDLPTEGLDPLMFGLYQSVNIIMVVAVICGWALHFYVITEMLWPAIRRKLSHTPHRVGSVYYSFYDLRRPLHYAFRVLLLLVQYALAMAVPHLEKIIPLVGFTAGMSIFFIFPPFLHTLTFWHLWCCTPGFERKKWWYACKNIALIVFGVFSLISGTYTSVKLLIFPSAN